MSGGVLCLLPEVSPWCRRVAPWGPGGMRNLELLGEGRPEYDRCVSLRPGQADDWAFMLAMAQSASTLDDRPLPEADDPAVRTLLPSSPENAVVAVDACVRAPRQRSGGTHLPARIGRARRADRRAALGDDRRSIAKVRRGHARPRTTAGLSRVGSQRLRTEQSWSVCGL
jgi:hypothetical protein